MEDNKKSNQNNNMSPISTSSPEKKPLQQEPIITTSTNFPAWKLYENPFYNPHQNHHHHHNHNHNHHHHHQIRSIATKSLQCLQLPLSARKLAASFWDLTFFRPALMESSSSLFSLSDELESARAELGELKAELEYERKARKKLESMNKRLAREAAEERRARESMERMCEDLAREVSSDKSEIARMKREIDDERKMMRMSEVLREERVQMKLADAKIALEEKLSQLDTQLGFQKTCHNNNNVNVNSFSGRFKQFVLGEKLSSSSSSSSSFSFCEDRQKSVRVDSMESSFMRSVFDHDHNGHNDDGGGGGGDGDDHHKKQCGYSNSTSLLPNNNNNNNTFQRKLVESENPHIKRGIKGFVEFPRVVRAIGTKNKQWGTKLECQKAQLRILLKQKSPIGSSNNNLIIS